MSIQDQQKKFTFLYHTKYKRVKKNLDKIDKKGKKEEEELEGEGEDMEMMDDVEIEGDAEGRIIYDWIRIDPEMDWLCELIFDEPDYMAMSQLRKDRDIIAQVEAIQMLSKTPSTLTSNALLTFIRDPNQFYRARVDAIYALAKHESSSPDEPSGLELIKRFYKEMYCRQMKDSSPNYFPKRNNFSHLQDYYIQKSIIIAISKTRIASQVPIESKRLVLDALMYNDNTSNEFSDVYWVATLMTALSDSFIPEFNKAVLGETTRNLNIEKTQVEIFDFAVSSVPVEPNQEEHDPLLIETFNEMERFRSKDRIVPSFHNIITACALEAYLKWMIVELIPSDISTFVSYSR